MTSLLAVGCLAGWVAVYATGRYTRARALHAARSARADRVRWEETQAAVDRVLSTTRADAAARAGVREARAVRLAEQARAARPLGADVGVDR